MRPPSRGSVALARALATVMMGIGCSDDASPPIQTDRCGSWFSQYCVNNTLITCHESEDVDGEMRDPYSTSHGCPAGTTCVETSPGEAGCAYPPCNDGTVSVCFNGELHLCEDGHVSPLGGSCLPGTTCLNVVDEMGMPRGVCALDPTPCSRPGESRECRGNTLTTCKDGYPIEAVLCPANQRCIDDGTTTQCS
ncbi:MAG: hypothetical protein JW751_06470 [Polyangiaceae bacterium]|nr:hypothetical protein [Polyangiaceae bacterium]